MNKYDDHDMKVIESDKSITREVKKESDDSVEVREDVINFQKESGNFLLAKDLGKQIWNYIYNRKSECDLPGNPITQLRSALCFLAVTAIENGLNDTLLSGACVTSFYGEVKAAESHLYAYIERSGAYSFYYLTMTHHNDIPEGIKVARVFFVTSNIDNTEDYIAKLGSEFNQVYATICKMINGVSFKKKLN